MRSDLEIMSLLWNDNLVILRNEGSASDEKQNVNTPLP